MKFRKKRLGGGVAPLITELLSISVLLVLVIRSNMPLTLALMLASPDSGVGLLDRIGMPSTCNWCEPSHLRFFDMVGEYQSKEELNDNELVIASPRTACDEREDEVQK